MASSYTGLGTELMTTGENAGTWGTTTNTNLQIIEQISGGYVEQAISSTTTTLSVSDGSTGATLGHRIIKFTGTLSGNSTVTIPLDVQQMYILVNGTSGTYTLTFKYVSGSGSTVAFGTTDKGTKIVYAAADHASNPNMVDTGISTNTLTGVTGDITVDSPADIILDADGANITMKDGGTTILDFVFNGTTDVTLDAPGDIKLDADGGDVFFVDGGTTFGSATNSSGNLILKSGTTTALTFSGANVTGSGTFEATTITASTSVIPDASGGADLGSTSAEWGDFYIADDKYINFGSDQNVVVGYDENGNDTLEFKANVEGAALALTFSADQADDNADTWKLNLADGGTWTWDSYTSGSFATKQTLDTSGNLTITGELDAATLDISGNADIDGTTNLDAVDIDGAVQLDATLTVGADDQGYDIKFFGDTASAYMLWDTSADDLVFAGSAGIDLAGDIDVDGTANLDNTDIDGTLAVDGTTISLDATTSLNIDNSNTSNGITIGTATSGVPISIGHATSEVTINDNLTVTGTLTLGSNAELTEAELEMLDGITAGTVAASKAVVVDSNKDAASFRNVTLTGELDAATLDISGNADIDGTTNLDAVDIDGAVQLDATFTVGADDQGYDVKLFGDTASAYMLWDTSADDLILAGGAGLIVPEGQFTLGSTAVSSTASELNLLDGGTSVGSSITLADSDGIVTNDGGTMKTIPASDVKTYVGAAAGAFSIANLDIDGGTDIGEAIVDADLFIIDNGAGGTNRKVAASRIVTYIDANSSAATVGKAIAMAIVFG
jgi:cytoskeletal protein CcmA (bactofilin family)